MWREILHLLQKGRDIWQSEPIGYHFYIINLSEYNAMLVEKESLEEQDNVKTWHAELVKH